MYFKRLLLLCALPFIVFANDFSSDTQFLALKINDLDLFIGVMSQKIETAQKLKDFSQMSYLQHAYNEAQANKEAAKALKQFLDGEIQLNGTQVISRLRTEEKFIRDADILLDSLVENGGKTPKGNKVLNSSIREVLGTDKIPVDLTIRDARRIRQNLHGSLAIKQHTAEALEHAHVSQKFTEETAMRYIDRRISSLANKTPNNPFYDDMVKFIIGTNSFTPPKILDFSSRSASLRPDLGSMRKANLYPVDSDGFFPNEAVVAHRLRPTPITPAVTAPPSSIFKKVLGVGIKGLKVVPLVSELWTAEENALLASAHSLSESCISNNQAGAGNRALYVVGQYIYRGVGFLSLAPNLADSADNKSMQGVLNFLLSAGCFDEYRIFVDKNKDVFGDLGLNELQILSPADISKKEKEYADLQKRLNTPLTKEEIITNKKAAQEIVSRELADKKAAFGACCMLVTTNACPFTDNKRPSPISNPLSAVRPTGNPILLNRNTAPVLTCAQLQADISRLENQLIVP